PASMPMSTVMNPSKRSARHTASYLPGRPSSPASSAPCTTIMAMKGNESKTMLKDTTAPATTPTETVIRKTVFPILLAISFSHLLNDTMQSLIPSTYPLLKRSLRLDFTQLGLITFCFQLTASLLQPFVGMYTDRKP